MIGSSPGIVRSWLEGRFGLLGGLCLEWARRLLEVWVISSWLWLEALLLLSIWIKSSGLSLLLLTKRIKSSGLALLLTERIITSRLAIESVRKSILLITSWLVLESSIGIADISSRLCLEMVWINWIARPIYCALLLIPLVETSRLSNLNWIIIEKRCRIALF